MTFTGKAAVAAAVAMFLLMIGFGLLMGFVIASAG